MGRPRKPDPEKKCKFCGVRLSRKRQGNGELEGLWTFNRRKFCGKRCSDHGKLRQPMTPNAGRYQAQVLFKAERCNRCTATERLHRHHIDEDPTNNTLSNIEILCAACHVRHHHQRRIKYSVCAVCRRIFLAASHRNRNKICSAECAREWGRMSARKRWAPDRQNSAATATQSLPKRRKSSSKRR